MNLKFAVTAILILLSQKVFTQSVDSLYEVGIWQGFRNAAVSYTFDDNTPGHLSAAVPLFDEFNFKATFYLITMTITDWSGYSAAALNGHEIGSHTVSHTSFAQLPDSLQEIELKNSRDTINKYVTGQDGLTFAYPYCITGNSNLVNDYYFAARGCAGYIEIPTPSDFMNVSSVICGIQGTVQTETDFKTKADNAVYYGGWCVYLLHGIDNDGGYSQLSSSVLRANLQYMKDNPGKFWVATFGNVAKYIRERDALSVDEIYAVEDSISLAVTDTLDNSLYNIPVTIRRMLPSSWSTAAVMQNGKEIQSEVVEIYSTKYVMFDVVPDAGQITLFHREPVEVGEHDPVIRSFSLYQNFPNPFNPLTKIKYSLPHREFVTITIFDLIGNEISGLVNDEQAGGNYELEFEASGLPSGVYFYKLKAGSFIQTRKMILMK